MFKNFKKILFGLCALTAMSFAQDDIEFVNLDSISREAKGNQFLDFSTMLIPITHKAPLGSPYGIRNHRLHRGVDVTAIKDEPVLAALPGRVIISKFNEGGYGNYVQIQHDNGIQTLYGHLNERLLKVGDYVVPGDIVGLAGNTGRSSGVHLHFEIRYGEVNIDPATIINFPKWEMMPGVDSVSVKEVTTAHYNIKAQLDGHIYTVKPGDNLKKIAKYFYISVEALCRINNINPKAPLRVGQQLRGSK